jgi:purine-binding chemotaxis protein CheW
VKKKPKKSGAASSKAPTTKGKDAKKPASAEPRAPERASSPVEIAAILRNTPTEILKAVRPPEPVKPVAEPAPCVPELSQDIVDYATTLRLRLAASAPSMDDQYGVIDLDTRPLRERVKDRLGIADLLMFRIGHELFATDLGTVEEAVELPEIHHLPEMPAAMLGAFNLRGRLTPIYSPAHVIGVPLLGVAAAALLVRANGRRMGLAVDDVEDVLQVDLATIREAPGIDDADGILLGVAHHGQHLVAIIDAEALVAACLTGHALETA